MSDRRRLIVLNGVANTNEPQWQILHSEQFSNPASVIAKINAVASIPPSSGTTYETWATDHALAAGSNRPLDDPDQDGWENALEFSAGTDPSSEQSWPIQTLERTATGFTMTYTRFVPAMNLTRTWQTGPLHRVSSDFNITNPLIEETSDPNVAQVTFTLPADFGPFIRLKVAVE